METPPRNTTPSQPEQNPTYLPDETPRREGGDDALAETNLTSTNADEKVIVNTQRENKTVNTPSQTAVNASEETGTDEDDI